MATRRQRKILEIQEYDRQRGRTEQRQKANNQRNKLRYYADREAAMEKQREYREANPEKYKARGAVSHALRDGKLKKEPCMYCGSKFSHAHHDDYSKPLEVKWVCRRHHGLLHRRYD